MVSLSPDPLPLTPLPGTLLRRWRMPLRGTSWKRVFLQECHLCHHQPAIRVCRNHFIYRVTHGLGLDLGYLIRQARLSIVRPETRRLQSGVGAEVFPLNDFNTHSWHRLFYDSFPARQTGASRPDLRHGCSPWWARRPRRTAMTCHGCRCHVSADRCAGYGNRRE